MLLKYQIHSEKCALIHRVSLPTFHLSPKRIPGLKGSPVGAPSLTFTQGHDRGKKYQNSVNPSASFEQEFFHNAKDTKVSLYNFQCFLQRNSHNNSLGYHLGRL